jgi:hypothetical protein
MKNKINLDKINFLIESKNNISDKFSIKLLRKSNSEIIFSIGGEDVFVFSDNLLHFNIIKKSDKVFGLG